jgi:hypothetical protein
MPAIAQPKFHISAHADYRRGDHSWSDVLIPALTAAAAMAVALTALY